MLVILFVTIVTVTILAINLDLKNLFSYDTTNTKNETKVIKKEKRVTFNLNKNQVKLISPRNKKNPNYQAVENTYIDYNDIPVIQKPSIVKD